MTNDKMRNEMNMKLCSDLNSDMRKRQPKLFVTLFTPFYLNFKLIPGYFSNNMHGYLRFHS